MYFSNIEKVAIVNIAINMEAADGKSEASEHLINTLVFQKLQINTNDLNAAKEMSAIDAMNVISTMTETKKDFICAFLGSLMAVDGDIDASEMALWRLVSTICKFPTMNIPNAIEKFKQYMKE